MNKPLKVKLGDLVNSEPALSDLAQADTSARMSFTLSLVLKEVGKHLDAKRATHQKLLEKYGTLKEGNPNLFEIKPEQRIAFEREFRELMDTEVELVGIGKIKVSAIESEGVKFSGQEMLTLSWLLKEDVQPLFDTE